MDVDVSNFLKRITHYKNVAEREMVEAMNDNRLDLEKHATLLAPIDKGTLQRSKVSTKPKWRGDVLESQIDRTPVRSTRQ
jgi:hypothetical protein